MEASADGRLAYISNYNQGNRAANTISVVDLVARKALPAIDLGALSRPHGLTMAGGKLYFTAEGAKVIGHYDGGKIDWVMGTGQNRTHMVIVSRDLKQIFTSNVASGSICVLEQGEGGRGGPGGPGRGAADWNVTVIPVGRGANRLKFTPSGKRVLISDLGGNELFVLDGASRTQLKKIDLGGGAAGILMDPHGQWAFVAVGSMNSVAVVDLGELKVARRIEAGPGPDGLAWAESK